jgi:hypothetical protein
MPLNGVPSMASVAKTVRRKIAEFGRNVLFTSRHLFCCGSRNAIDIELYRLVKAGIIMRLTSGVFMRVLEGLQLPSPLEIAKIKSQRFCRRLYEAGERQAEDAPAACSYTFHTDGCRTSMLTLLGRIIFKHCAPAKATDRTCQRPQPVARQTGLERMSQEVTRTKHSLDDRTGKARSPCFCAAPTPFSTLPTPYFFLRRRFSSRN